VGVSPTAQPLMARLIGALRRFHPVVITAEICVITKEVICCSM
jgi:hypothetical protein